MKWSGMAPPVTVFVNTFNHLRFTRDTVSFLASLESVRPIVIDNASTFPPLIEWYETSPCEVIRLPTNMGARAPWLSGAVDRDAGEHYAVTDFDLDLSTLPSGFLDQLIETLERNPSISKCGLALRIDDLPDEFPLKEPTLSWERQFWEEEVSPDVFRAAIDTTFAVYSKNRSLEGRFYEGYRLAGPLTVRHRPWYWTADSLDDDDIYYIATTEVASGWKKVILHAIAADAAAARLRPWLPAERLSRLDREREIADRLVQTIIAKSASKVLFTSAGDGALTFLGGTKLRELGGDCAGVAYAGRGENYQAVKRLLLGLPIEVLPGSVLDQPVNGSFDLVVFNGKPSAIQYMEWKHIGKPDAAASLFTGLGVGGALDFFFDKHISRVRAGVS